MFPITTTALVIDDALTVRQSVRTILGQLGITRAESASTIGEARRKLNGRSYDLILCDYHFGPGTSGQEFLEELRRGRIMPLATIFFMITAESSYERVVAVAEVAPDDYLLKPFTSAHLGDRLLKAWHKKIFLGPIFKAIESNRHDDAVDIAYAKLREASPYQPDLQRLLAQLLTELGRFDEAATLLQQILATRMVPWAKLGLARIYDLEGRTEESEEMMVEILADSQHYVDAYDQLAQHYLLTERETEALQVLEQALKVTPCNVSRLQQAGQVAFRMGNSDMARRYLEKAVHHGGNSTVLDIRSMFYLAISQLREGKQGDAEKMQLMMQTTIDKHPSYEGQALLHLLAAAQRALVGQIDGATSKLREVTVDLLEPVVDLTLAGDILSVCALLPIGEQNAILWTRQAARRFAVSRMANEKLEIAVRNVPSLAELVRSEAQEINLLANQGMMLLVHNKLDAAVKHLFRHSQESRNSRLLLAAANACLRAARQSRQLDLLTQAETCADLLQRQQYEPRVVGQLSKELELARLELERSQP